MSQDLTARIKQLESQIIELKAAVEELKKNQIYHIEPVDSPLSALVNQKRQTITLKKT